MNGFYVPTVPNSPLISTTDRQHFGELKLRLNETLHFIENSAFDPALATYDDNYQNSQAYSKLFFQHMKDVLELLKEQFREGSVVVEVGCGKGDFVELLQSDAYFHVTGYDATYEGNNPLIERRYLTSTDRVKADLVILRHVLEHIKAPHNFLTMLKQVFGKAQIYIEVPSFDWIVENEAFFDITYEHVNYFSKASMRALFDPPATATGLCFNGQYLYAIADISSLSDRFSELYENGRWVDLDFESLFPNMLAKMSSIERLLGTDNRLYVWGAATKGCMFLVHCASRNRLIRNVGFAIDKNPRKCGKYLPGSLIPIKSGNEFFQVVRSGDILLIANPNYKEEIVGELEARGIRDIQIVCL